VRHRMARPEHRRLRPKTKFTCPLLAGGAPPRSVRKSSFSLRFFAGLL
jgi:hypothetical protein